MSDLDKFIRAVEERVDPSRLFERVVGTPDPWQSDFLTSTSQFLAVLCSRQTGKSSSVSCLAAQAVERGETVIIVAPFLAQAKELFLKVEMFWEALRADKGPPRNKTQTSLHLHNGGRVMCLAATPENVRGYTVKKGLIILEEAAFIPDDVFDAVIPARSEEGRVILISTPNGRQGQFYDYWEGGDVDRILARSLDQPRLTEKVAFDRKVMPPLKFSVEHECRFLGSGRPYFDFTTIRDAFVDEPQLKLGDFYAPDRTGRETDLAVA